MHAELRGGGQLPLAGLMIAHRQAVLQGCQGGAVSTSVFLYSFYLRPVNGYPKRGHQGTGKSEILKRILRAGRLNFEGGSSRDARGIPEHRIDVYRFHTANPASSACP